MSAEHQDSSAGHRSFPAIDAADALVVLGASGDLAARMIHPALFRLAARGALDVPVIGLATSIPDRGAYLARVRESIEAALPRVDPLAWESLAGRLDYVHGDLHAAATYAALRGALGAARRPLVYLAIPPDLFAPVLLALAQADIGGDVRVAVEKPFGHDLASSRALATMLEEGFAAGRIFRVDHFLAADPVRSLLHFRCVNAFAAALWRRQHVERVEITMAEAFGVEDRGRFYDGVGALRDVVQNHVMQLLAMVAMEPPTDLAAEAIQANRVAILNAVRPLAAKDVVRGQYEGYRDTRGVAPGSDTETYVAMRLAIDTPRWAGVPFHLRTGKRLAVTATEVGIDLRGDAGCARGSRFRFRLGPGDVMFALDAVAKRPGAEMAGEQAELALPRGTADDIDAYEYLLQGALAGRQDLFDRQAAIDAAWRIFAAVLAAPPPVEPYPQGSWGPVRARTLAGSAGWHDPAPDKHRSR